MSEVEQAEQDLKALEAFIVGNSDLERLDALLDRFNIFEAIGMERQEIRHSRFLAFLLDPNESHGMGDAFVKRLLQRAVMDAPNASVAVTPIELSLWDLSQMEVRREWRRIDVFLVDERNQLVVIIENKIGAGEHGDQLDRYHEAVREEYPDHKLLALYLTPDGDEPSHPDYLPVDYRAVCEILDDLAESQASVIEPDLRVLITHYTDMLRRHIVGDSEIARLSQQVYRKHQRAIELIYEHRFAERDALSKVLVRLIEEASSLDLGYRDKDDSGEYIVFEPRSWRVPALEMGRSYRGSRRILYFVLYSNPPNSLDLWLELGSGNEKTRHRLANMARGNPSVFGEEVSAELLEEDVLFSRTLLAEGFCESTKDTEREAEIRKNWADFLENDLPRLDAALKQEAWIWEPED